MKIPKITREAMEAVRPGSIYDWLEREQPELFKWAHLQKDGEEDPFFEERANILLGAAFTLRCLEETPAPPSFLTAAVMERVLDKTPPDGTETLQDRLSRIRAILDSPGVTTGGLCTLEWVVARIREICSE